VSVYFTGAIITAVFAAILAFPMLYYRVFLLIPGVAKYSSGDVLNRYILFIIVLTIWWSYSRLGLGSIHLGRPTVSKLRVAAWSMVIGSALIALFFVSKLVMGQGYLNPSALLRMGLLKTILWYLLGALAVGLLEEVLFRGVALQVFLEDRRTTRFAILLSALLFAAVHFIEFSEVADTVLGTNIVDGAIFSLNSSAKFILLTVTGVLLAYTRQRTNTLYAAIGLHAGMVLTLRLFNKVFKANPGYSGNIFLLNGADALLILAIFALAFLLVRFLSRELQPRYKQKYFYR